MVGKKLEIPRSLSDQISDIILEQIIAGELKAGDRIEISRLADAYKISRSPVKDALNKLHGSGIVEISPRIGHYVRRMSKEDIIDIFELRLMLELMAVRRITASITQEDRSFFSINVEQSIKLANQKSFSLVKLYNFDREFHRKLVSLSQNPVIESIHKTIHLLSHVARTMLPEKAERTIECQLEHQVILSALEAGDKEELEKALTVHFKNGEQYLIQAFEAESAVGD